MAARGGGVESHDGGSKDGIGSEGPPNGHGSGTDEQSGREGKGRRADGTAEVERRGNGGETGDGRTDERGWSGLVEAGKRLADLRIDPLDALDPLDATDPVEDRPVGHTSSPLPVAAGDAADPAGFNRLVHTLDSDLAQQLAFEQLSRALSAFVAHATGRGGAEIDQRPTVDVVLPLTIQQVALEAHKAGRHVVLTRSDGNCLPSALAIIALHFGSTDHADFRRIREALGNFVVDSGAELFERVGLQMSHATDRPYALPHLVNSLFGKHGSAAERSDPAYNSPDVAVARLARQMRTNGEWLNSEVAIIAARCIPGLVGRRVVVLEGQQGKAVWRFHTTAGLLAPIPVSAPITDRDIVLAHVGRNHYVAILPGRATAGETEARASETGGKGSKEAKGPAGKKVGTTDAGRKKGDGVGAGAHDGESTESDDAWEAVLGLGSEELPQAPTGEAALEILAAGIARLDPSGTFLRRLRRRFADPTSTPQSEYERLWIEQTLQQANEIYANAGIADRFKLGDFARPSNAYLLGALSFLLVYPPEKGQSFVWAPEAWTTRQFIEKLLGEWGGVDRSWSKDSGLHHEPIQYVRRLPDDPDAIPPSSLGPRQQAPLPSFARNQRVDAIAPVEEAYAPELDGSAAEALLAFGVGRDPEGFPELEPVFGGPLEVRRELAMLFGSFFRRLLGMRLRDILGITVVFGATGRVALDEEVKQVKIDGQGGGALRVRETSVEFAVPAFEERGVEEESEVTVDLVGIVDGNGDLQHVVLHLDHPSVGHYTKGSLRDFTLMGRGLAIDAILNALATFGGKEVPELYRSSILDTCLPYRDAYEAAQAEGFNAMRSICGLRTHEKRNSRVIPFRNLPAHVKREILADPEINYDIAPPDYERKKNGRKSNAKGPISWLAHFLIHRQKEFADWAESKNPNVHYERIDKMNARCLELYGEGWRQRAANRYWALVDEIGRAEHGRLISAGMAAAARSKTEAERRAQLDRRSATVRQNAKAPAGSKARKSYDNQMSFAIARRCKDHQAVQEGKTPAPYRTCHGFSRVFGVSGMKGECKGPWCPRCEKSKKTRTRTAFVNAHPEVVALWRRQLDGLRAAFPEHEDDWDEIEEGLDDA